MAVVLLGQNFKVPQAAVCKIIIFIAIFMILHAPSKMDVLFNALQAARVWRYGKINSCGM
jgi:hypothetical protein